MSSSFRRAALAGGLTPPCHVRPAVVPHRRRALAVRSLGGRSWSSGRPIAPHRGRPDVGAALRGPLPLRPAVTAFDSLLFSGSDLGSDSRSRLNATPLNGRHDQCFLLVRGVLAPGGSTAPDREGGRTWRIRMTPRGPAVHHSAGVNPRSSRTSRMTRCSSSIQRALLSGPFRSRASSTLRRTMCFARSRWRGGSCRGPARRGTRRSTPGHRRRLGGSNNRSRPQSQYSRSNRDLPG